MKPRDISKTKQIITHILGIITAVLIVYASIVFYKINMALFYVWLISIGLLLYYMVFIEPNMLYFSLKEVAIKNLPKNFKGKTLVHISDIHFGSLFGVKAAKKLIERINNLNADFVCITGDFLSINEPKKITPLTDEIKKIKANYGIFAVFGNHDYYGNAQFLKQELTKGGINFLVNEAKEITNNGENIWIVGVDDPYHKYDDLKAALKNVPKDAVKILLAHSPEIVPRAVDENIDFALMGHTHGGQARLPGYKQILSLSKHLKKYMSGFFKVNNTQFYVNRGIGRVTLPIRFLSPPEIAVFVLR